MKCRHPCRVILRIRSAVDGVAPEPETLRDRSYPLTRHVRLVARKGVVDRLLWQRSCEWFLSADGQRAVAECGYVTVEAR